MVVLDAAGGVISTGFHLFPLVDEDLPPSRLPAQLIK